MYIYMNMYVYDLHTRVCYNSTYHGPSIVYIWMDDHPYDCKTNVMC